MATLSNLSYNEFLAFTLLYVSSVDSKIDDNEIQIIICKVGNDICKKIQNEFDKLNEYERLQMILSYKNQYFSSSEQKEKLLNDVKEVFLSDNRLDNFEQGVMVYLKRLLA